MNRFFKSIWSDALGVWIATSELSAARGKRASTSLKAVAVAAALMFGTSGTATAAFTTGSADGLHDLAIGIGSVAVVDSNPLGNDAIAIGHLAKSTAVGAIAFGASASAGAANSVALGSNSVANRANTVAVGNRQIAQVKAGTDGLDAVNVNQLKVVTDALGGGTTIDPVTGTVTPPTFTVGGKPVHTVDDAIDEIDKGLENAVKYDGPGKTSVTLEGTGGTQIHKVANGTADQDAINLSQLKDVGAKTDANGAITNAFVAYDDKMKKDSVTLEGANGTQIHKVAKGTADQDAINLSQLKDAGVKTDASGNVTNAFVAYDDKTKKDSVTLEGANGTQIHKVAKGTADQDAINLSQLKEAGIKTDASGNFTNALVAYDDKTMNSVTLGGVNGTTIDKVKAGKLSSTSMEAVNGAQLYATNEQVNKNTGDITNINNTINNINKSSGLIAQDEVSREITIGAKTDGTSISLTGTAGNRVVSGVAAGEVSATSTQAINGSQLHNTASSVATALGGGAGIDANGGVTPPTYHVGGVDTHDVGTALSNIDGRVTQITTTVNEASKNAVKYDSDAHDKVTLGGTDAAGGEGVQLTNVKAGELSATSTDAINGAQLNATNVRIDQYESIVNNISTGSEYLAINSEKGSPLPTATGKDAVALGSNSKATGDNSVALGANSVADQPNTVSVGSEGNERRITNLAPGKAGTDAANVNQLNDVRNSVLANQRAAFGGVASALAMPNMTPREAGNTVVAVGIGSCKGYSAVGVSGTYRSRDGAWLLNGGFSSTGHGDAGVRAQVGYEF